MILVILIAFAVSVAENNSKKGLPFDLIVI